MGNVTHINFTAKKTPTDEEANEFLEALERVIEECAKQSERTRTPWVHENMEDVLDALIDIKVDIKDYMQEVKENEQR